MEENKKPSKIPPIIGILIALGLLGLSGAVIAEVLLGELSVDWGSLFVAVLFVLLGGYILFRSVCSLLGKTKQTEKPAEDKPFDPKPLVLPLVLVGAVSLILGCLMAMPFLIVCGVFLVVFPTAAFFSIKKDEAIAKKHGDQAQNVLDKRHKKGRFTPLILFVVILVLAGLLLSIFTASDKKDHNVCGYCSEEFTDEDDLHSIAKTGMCEDCSWAFEILGEFDE